MCHSGRARASRRVSSFLGLESSDDKSLIVRLVFSFSSIPSFWEGEGSLFHSVFEVQSLQKEEGAGIVLFQQDGLPCVHRVGLRFCILAEEALGRYFAHPNCRVF